MTKNYMDLVIVLYAAGIILTLAGLGYVGAVFMAIGAIISCGHLPIREAPKPSYYRRYDLSA